MIPLNLLRLISLIRLQDFYHYKIDCICRARLTNAHLGKEVETGSIQLIVEESDYLEEDSLSIIVPPSNITVIVGANTAELQCIANAR